MRESKHEWFMKRAHLVATQATCDRAHVGCLLVREGHIISAGYNGSLPSLDHCDDVGHDMHESHCVRVTHAEMNALMQAAKMGHATKGAHAYITHMPCWLCFKLLVQAGITGIIYDESYRIDDRILDAERKLRANGHPIRIINISEANSWP